MKHSKNYFILFLVAIIIIFYTMILFIPKSAFGAENDDPYAGGYLYDERNELYINDPLYRAIEQISDEYNYPIDEYYRIAYRSFNNYYVVTFVPKNLQIRAIFNYAYQNNISYRTMTFGFFNANNQQVFKDNGTNVYFRIKTEGIEQITSNNIALTVTSHLQTIDYPLPIDGVDIDINMVRIIEDLGLFNNTEIFAYNTRSFSDSPSDNNVQNWRIIRKNWVGGFGLLKPDSPNWNDYVGVSIGDPYQYLTPHSDGDLPWWDKVLQAFEDVEDIFDIPTLLKDLFQLVLEGLMNIGDAILNLPLNISDYLYKIFVPSSENITEWQNKINSTTDTITDKLQPLKNWLISDNNVGYPPALHSVKVVGTNIMPDNDVTLIDWYTLATYIVPYQYVIHIFITIYLCIMSANFIFETFDIKTRLAWDSIREVATY